MSPEAEAVFLPGSIALFRSAHKIDSYLVRAKLYSLERFIGSRQCKRCICEVCTNITETDTFSITVKGATFQINHELNCLIYLLKCKVNEKQYLGETTDTFPLRWNNYKGNVRKFWRNESCIQQHLCEHFYGEGHNGFSWHVSVSLIGKTDSFKEKGKLVDRNSKDPSPVRA